MALSGEPPRVGLEVGPRRRLAQGVAALTALLVLGVLVWYVNSPADLPTSDAQVTASTPVDQPVYIGVFAPGTEFDRTLHLSGVKVHTTASSEVEVEPLLCRGGDVAVTSDPTVFCEELVDTEGASFGPGDDIVLRVSAPISAVAVIDRVRLGFREGLQFGTLAAGSPAVVRILER